MVTVVGYYLHTFVYLLLHIASVGSMLIGN